MGKHVASLGALSASRSLDNRAVVHRPRLARNAKLLAFSTIAVIWGLLLVSTMDPYSGAVASPSFRVASGIWDVDGQSVRSGSGAVASARDGLDTVSRVNIVGGIPAAGVPDPGTAQAIGYEMVIARGWSTQEFDCLVLLWNRESHWNVYANNQSSGAYGIPQALPGDKMASAGPDWQTNPATQITWGLNYIAARYDTPCGAWAHSEDVGWY